MKRLLIFFIALLSFNNLFSQKYTDTYIKNANKVALDWCNQINTGQYEKAYNKLADVLKDRATLKDWLTQISILMHEFGYIENRIVTDTYFKSESLLLKQSDKLEWEIFNYDYAFQHLENKK